VRVGEANIGSEEIVNLNNSLSLDGKRGDVYLESLNPVVHA
jgi:hypothetical protein